MSPMSGVIDQPDRVIARCNLLVLQIKGSDQDGVTIGFDDFNYLEAEAAQGR